ncbi:MAG: peptidoglycan-binding domain-containing protein [Gammaproteobacteria bacterium]
MISITASVGKGGVNRHNDTLAIQKLINKNIGSLTPLRPLAEDGRIGPMTIGAIEAFQRRVVGLRLVDGRVDPNGRTLRTLNEKAKTAPPSPPTPPLPAGGNYKVTYSTNIKAADQIVSNYSIDVIKLALKKAGMAHAVMTSTIRTPEKQASIMYDNAKKNLAAQFQLYGSTGDEVLKVFQNNQTKEKSVVIGLMQEKIESLLKQGRRTSLHCVTQNEYKNRNIIDIGVNSTRAACGASFNIENFTKAFNELKNEGYIERFIDETKKSNTCWHIEIKPNKKPIP